MGALRAVGAAQSLQRRSLQLHVQGGTQGALEKGKFIAIGDLEVAVKSHPWIHEYGALGAKDLEAWLAQPREYMDLATGRWWFRDCSAPYMYRTLPLAWCGNLGRLGMDFWNAGEKGAEFNHSYFTASDALTAPGEAGAMPTVRFQMLREGVQGVELRLRILRKLPGLPAEKQTEYRSLLNTLAYRWGCGSSHISQLELAYDWPAYAAKVQEMAAALDGATAAATWTAPPIP